MHREPKANHCRLENSCGNARTQTWWHFLHRKFSLCKRRSLFSNWSQFQCPGTKRRMDVCMQEDSLELRKEQCYWWDFGYSIAFLIFCMSTRAVMNCSDGKTSCIIHLKWAWLYLIGFCQLYFIISHYGFYIGDRHSKNNLNKSISSSASLFLDVFFPGYKARDLESLQYHHKKFLLG